jgi:hypothetical protein
VGAHRDAQGAGAAPATSGKPGKKAPPPKSTKLSRKLDRALSAFDRTTASLASHAATQLPRRVSGFQVPALANHQSTRTILLLVERFKKKREHIGLKSYAVYLLPGLALRLGGLILSWGRVAWVAAALAAICLAVAGVGAWKLLTTPLDTPVLMIRIDYGLWLSLAGYVGLAASALGRFLPRSLLRAAR